MGSVLTEGSGSTVYIPRTPVHNTGKPPHHTGKPSHHTGKPPHHIADDDMPGDNACGELGFINLWCKSIFFWWSNKSTDKFVYSSNCIFINLSIDFANTGKTLFCFTYVWLKSMRLNKNVLN